MTAIIRGVYGFQHFLLAQNSWMVFLVISSFPGISASSFLWGCFTAAQPCREAFLVTLPINTFHLSQSGFAEQQSVGLTAQGFTACAELKWNL